MTMEIGFKLSFWWAACWVGILVLCFGLESLVAAEDDKNLVANGDFESGPWILRYSSLGVLIPPTTYEDSSPVPDWVVETGKAVRYIDSDHFWVPEGKRAIHLLSGMDGSIYQTIYTGNTYSLFFLLGEAGDSCRDPMAVTASAGNQSQDASYSSSTRYQSYNMSFLADSEMTRISFHSKYFNTKIGDNSSLCGPVIEGVKVTDHGQVIIGEALKVYTFRWSISKDHDHSGALKNENGSISNDVETTIVSLLPPEKGSASCNFLLKLLKAATIP